MYHVHVPEILPDKELINFFKGWRWVRQPNTTVEIDFTHCTFLAPYAATLFAAYGVFLNETKKWKLNIKANRESTTGRYLSQVGFFELFGEDPDPLVIPRPERVVKLTRINSSSEIPAFATKVMDILQIEDEELGGAIKYSLIELLRNVVQHSKSHIGGIAMAQYFPTTGLVELCVADMGVGLKATLKNAYPELETELQAVKLSTLPHVSGTFGPSVYSTMRDNAGLGLFFIKQITSLAGGSFFLISNEALTELWAGTDGDQKKIYKIANNGGWPGTFAYLQLRRDSIAEFDEVLTTCRTMAAEARKYPSELALDFIEGIPDLPGLLVIRVAEFEEDVEAAAKCREDIILPHIQDGKMLVLDFDGVRFATQSFAHALMYRVIRDGQQVGSTLSIANCTNATREAIMAVATYAKVQGDSQ